LFTGRNSRDLWYVFTKIFLFLTLFNVFKILLIHWTIDIMAPYGLDQEALEPVIDKFKSDPQKFVDFMMKFELNLEKPNPSRSWVSLEI
jgi:hypothetical protein